MDDREPGEVGVERVCSRQGCHNMASVKPRLWFRTSKRGVPSQAIIQLEVCELCAVQSIVSDFLSDAGWRQVVLAHAARNKRKPKRRFTTMDFVPLDYGRDTGGIQTDGRIGIGT